MSKKCNFNNLNGNVYAFFLCHKHSLGSLFGLLCTECKLCERLMRIFFFFRYLWPQWQKYFGWHNALLLPKSRHVEIRHAILCSVTRAHHQAGGWGGRPFISGSVRRATAPPSLMRFSHGSHFVFGRFRLPEESENGEEVLRATMQHRIQDMCGETRPFCYSQGRGPPEGVASRNIAQRLPATTDLRETFWLQVCDQIRGSCFSERHGANEVPELPQLLDEKRKERTRGLLGPSFQQTAPCCKVELVSVLKTS